MMTNEKKPDYSLCPSCPEIKKKIDRIDLALLGEDGTGLNGGIVKAITDLQKKGKVQASWMSIAKPIAVGALSAAITLVLTFLLSH
jgi:hypothetical protein